MPFTSGVASTPSELLNALNTHLVANGWTKLRGETDMNVASPKSARYWRVLTWNSINWVRGVRILEMRTTAGGANQATVGANFTVSSVNEGSPTTLPTGGSNVRSATIYDTPWSLAYDFGAPTIIRELSIQGDSTSGNSPSDFCLQWSNDNITWTTMQEFTGLTWTASETKTFTVTDGYVHGQHVSSTQPRRSGSQEKFDLNVLLTTSDFRAMSNDYWIWQGPGYDADRRVYVHARGQCKENSSAHYIEFDFSIGYDSLIKAWNTQEGHTGRAMCHMMDSAEISYWIYSNSKRIILITRSGAQDYTSTYIGFMSAFGLPDDYPFPLLLSTTIANVDAYTPVTVNAVISSCADPGVGACIVRLWDGTFKYPENRPSSSASNLYSAVPTNAWVWPYHMGTTARPTWPYGIGSDWNDYVANHFFDYVQATEQGELPMFPCIVMCDPYGNIGAMDGIFAIPSGGLLTPTQVITIGGQNYRVFPNRTRREPIAWFCVRED